MPGAPDLDFEIWEIYPIRNRSASFMRVFLRMSGKARTHAQEPRVSI